MDDLKKIFEVDSMSQFDSDDIKQFIDDYSIYDCPFILGNPAIDEVDGVAICVFNNKFYKVDYYTWDRDQGGIYCVYDNIPDEISIKDVKLFIDALDSNLSIKINNKIYISF